MRKSAIMIALATVLAAMLSGCGGKGTSGGSTFTVSGQGGSTSTVSAFMSSSGGDLATAVKADVTGVSLSDGTNTATLSNTTATLELKHLELAEALVARNNVTAGNYTAVNVNFANPQLQVADALGNVTQVSSSGTPSVRLAHSSVSIPLTLAAVASANEGFILKLDLQKSLTIDSNGNYVLDPTFTASAVSSSNSAILHDSIAKVTTVASSSGTFDVQLSDGGATIHVVTGSATLFATSIGNVAGLKTGQYIELDAAYQTDGSYLAQYVNSGPADPTALTRGVVSAVPVDASGTASVAVVVQN